MNRLTAAAATAALATLAAVASTLTGCATASPDVVSPYHAQQMSTVYDGVILSSRPVVIEGSQSGLGGTAGAVTGAVAGSSIGGSRESVVFGVLGAVAGGVIGNQVERHSTREDAVELLIQLKNGERRSVVQAKGVDVLNPGDSVILVVTDGRARVSKAPVPTPTATNTSSAAPAR